MKTLFLIFSIVFCMSAFGADDPSQLLKKYITYYDTEYEGYLKSKYQLSVSEYYWKKVKDVKAFGVAIVRKSDEILGKSRNLRDRFNKLKFGDKETVERLSLMRALYFDLKHQKNTIDQYADSLNYTRSSVHLTCNEAHINEMTSKLDPELMYTIPQYVFDPTGAPKLDINYYFSLSYNYGSGFDAAGGTEGTMSDEQGMLVYGGAALVTAAFMACGVEDPVTLSAVFAGTAAVLKGAVDLYTDLVGSSEYVKKMKELEREYGNLNKLIVQKHKNVSDIRSEIISSRCDETIGTPKDADIEMLPVYLESVMRSIQLKHKEISELHDIVTTDLKNEERSLLDKVVSSKEFFSKHTKRVGEMYAKEMNKLFSYELQLDNASLIYFLNSPAITYAQYQNSRTESEKMKNLGNLWTNLIEGEAKFNSESAPQSINWNSMKESLENSLFMEGL